MSNHGPSKQPPPLGVIPLYLWMEHHPEPTLSQLTERYGQVAAAVQRYRQAKLLPYQEWLAELGLFPQEWWPLPVTAP